jgi:hypothetical protein
MILGPISLVGVAYIARNLRAADHREIAATRWAEWEPDEFAMEIMSWTKLGPSYLVYGRDGPPVAVFGATQPWPGMFSAWLIGTADFPSVALPLTKFVKRVFVPHLRERAHRIEARSIDGHAHAHRWLKALGAKEEGRMHGYGKDGEDFLVFTLPATNRASIVDNSD